MLQDDDHYDKRDVPSLPKRAKTEEAPAGPLATPPDPYAAMALYYSKLHSSFRPWSPKIRTWESPASVRRPSGAG